MTERFLLRFPEFVNTEIKLIEMALAESKNEMGKNHWGDMHELACNYLAAHKLAISPMGEPARLEGAQEKTVYLLEYERLCRSAFLGARVA